jgi:SAM-dependent methyltransferase
MSNANQAQADYWSSPAGRKWIENEQVLDRAMAPMLDALLEAAALTEEERVLDVGCGTGMSTLAAARVAAKGEILGIDISAPLLDRARARAQAARLANISFLLADAQTHELPAGRFDVLISRIGMSFFADTVTALHNLATALRQGGRMAFVSWAEIDRNPWFSVPKNAAEARLGPSQGSDPTAPGPLAFQDPDRVADLMEMAGLSEIQAGPLEIILTPPGGTRGAARAASRVGPAARVMKAHNGTETDALAIEDEVEKGFAAFERNGVVCVPAVVNLFTCTCGKPTGS